MVCGTRYLYPLDRRELYFVALPRSTSAPLRGTPEPHIHHIHIHTRPLRPPPFPLSTSAAFHLSPIRRQTTQGSRSRRFVPYHLPICLSAPQVAVQLSAVRLAWSCDDSSWSDLALRFPCKKAAAARLTCTARRLDFLSKTTPSRVSSAPKPRLCPPKRRSWSRSLLPAPAPLAEVTRARMAARVTRQPSPPLRRADRLP